MNNLSWILYFVDVIDNLNTVFGWMAALGTMGLIVTTICWLIDKANPGDKDFDPLRSILPIMRHIFLPVFFIGWIAVVFMPSQRTFILIAASQIGEKIVNSDTAKNMATAASDRIFNPSVELLEVWIKKETAKIQKEIEYTTRTVDSQQKK